MSTADADAGAGRLPPVPGYAWSWLQRSRPVLAEVARRLTGEPPTPKFVEDLRARAAGDPFTRDVLLDVIAEVAFSGRVPASRPPGVTWDRGLRWWAAVLAGTTPDAYDTPPPDPSRQPPLFGAAAPQPPEPAPVEPVAATARRVPAAVARERREIAETLRGLIRVSEGGCVPASALRHVADTLDPR